MKTSAVKALDAREPLLVGSGFSSGGFFPTTPKPHLDANIGVFGSWLGSNVPTGTVHTSWYRAVPKFAILIAGYPSVTGNRLFVEVETSKGQHVQLPITEGQHPAESWRMQEFQLRRISSAVKFRIVAIDGSTSFWLAFSQPFVIRSVDDAEILKQGLLVGLATVASFVFFWYPGLAVARLFRSVSFIWLPIPGILLLAFIGLLAWKTGASFSPRFISSSFLWLIALAALYDLIRLPLSRRTSPVERNVLVSLIVLALLAVGRSTYSVDSVGDLYGESISRTLEVGDRSDSRIPYVNVELVALRQSAYSRFAQTLFAPWNFSYRGPLAGLAASPIVLVGPINVLATFPDQPWTIFDPEGFAAYRSAMIVMTCCGLITIFGVARLFLDEKWALLAFLVTMTSPFVIHEVYFTWPKLLSSAFVLLAVHLILRDKFSLAGLAVGVGYLCHPSALVWILPLVGIAAIKTFGEKTTVKLALRLCRLLGRCALFALGLAITVLFWMHVNRNHFEQMNFLVFAKFAAGRPPTFENWVLSRWDSLRNTLLPGFLLIANRRNPAINNIYGPSPITAQISFLYWNTLPFGTGVVFYLTSVPCLVIAAFRWALPWLILVFAVPFIFFTTYMGAVSTGMLRDGLHTWFLGFMIFLVVIWCRFLRHSERFWKVSSVAIGIRGIEILVMLIIPSALSQHMLYQTRYALSDLISLAVMVVSTVFLVRSAFCLSEFLRREQRNAETV